MGGTPNLEKLEDTGTKKTKKGKKGSKTKDNDADKALEAHGQGQPEMTLDMFSEGSMEDHDAHVCRIFASLKQDKDLTYLVQLPEGFGKVYTLRLASKGGYEMSNC